MKNITRTLLILLLAISACRKDNTETAPISQGTQTETITLDEAKAWYNNQQNTTILKKHPIDWNSAKSIRTKDGNRIAIPIQGKPIYQNIRQGYRQLSIQRNLGTKNIEAHFLEIIPDALYFQAKQKVSQKDFTGRILVYDLSYHLQSGRIYAGGKQMGESRPATKQEKLAYFNPDHSSPLQPLQLNFEQGANSATDHNKTAMAQIIGSCNWVTSTYIDAEGIFTVYAESYCDFYIYDSGNYNDGGIDQEVYNPSDGGGGGGGSSAETNPTPPEPSNIPGENNNNVDPKKMTECFSNINDPAAAYQVKVLVVEPMPGTFFNVGPNSFGHVAIQLTKTGNHGASSITQTIGFYGSGSGLDKLISPSTIKDNGDIEYTMSATYWSNAADFQKILDYVANPPKNYHFTDFNCAAFVYQAAQKGNLPVPDPTTTFGMFAGPGGAGYGMSPAGMASALREQAANNPGANISGATGRAPKSKGECN